MDIAMTHLKSVLHQPASISTNDRKTLSDLLFNCYLQKYLANPDDFAVIFVCVTVN